MNAALEEFTRDVTAQRRHNLTGAEAEYLIALAQNTAANRTFKPPKPPPPCTHKSI